MSAFARAELMKYGWKEGMGLGKHEDGIKQALKPKLKFDNNGLGYDIGKEFKNEWWNEVYNKAAKNIEILDNEDGSSTIQWIPKKSEKRRKIQKQISSYTENYVKAKPDPAIEITEMNQIEESSENESSSVNVEEVVWKKYKRTAHKAARLGLSLNGKLLRLQQQEELSLKNSLNNTYDQSILQEEKIGNSLQNEHDVCDMTKNNSSLKEKKRRKHKRNS